MRVERGDFIDLDQREAHFARERNKMAGVEALEAVLQEMQVLDQKVAPPRAIGQKSAHIIQRVGLDLSPPRHIPGLVPAPPRMVSCMGVRSPTHRRFVSSFGLSRPRSRRGGINPKTATIVRKMRPLRRISPARYSETERPRMRQAP